MKLADIIKKLDISEEAWDIIKAKYALRNKIKQNQFDRIKNYINKIDSPTDFIKGVRIPICLQPMG